MKQFMLSILCCFTAAWIVGCAPIQRAPAAEEGSASAAVDCTLQEVGAVTGAVEVAGERGGDGAFATFIYDGPPIHAVRIRDGSFTAPMLAMACGDELHYLGFQLTVGDWRRYIQPQQPNLAGTVELAVAPLVVEAAAEKRVLLGEISGRITGDGAPVPDGTTARVVVVGSGLAQTVHTQDGRYRATTVGVQEGETEHYFPIVVEVNGAAQNFAPSVRQAVLDIDLATQQAVWCFDVVEDKSGARHIFGHPPGTQAPGVAASVEGTAGERRCFARWADAAAYITDGAVLLPDDATEEDYVRETDWFFRAGVTPAAAP
ncbi:MAG: hypothetical protein WAU00_19980 [Caldilinea sp.]